MRAGSVASWNETARRTAYAAVAAGCPLSDASSSHAVGKGGRKASRSVSRAIQRRPLSAVARAIQRFVPICHLSEAPSEWSTCQADLRTSNAGARTRRRLTRYDGACALRREHDSRRHFGWPFGRTTRNS
jgi:hypothetical protein